jgi:hypothetical protein
MAGDWPGLILQFCFQSKAASQQFWRPRPCEICICSIRSAACENSKGRRGAPLVGLSEDGLDRIARSSYFRFSDSAAAALFLQTKIPDRCRPDRRSCSAAAQEYGLACDVIGTASGNPHTCATTYSNIDPPTKAQASILGSLHDQDRSADRPEPP